MSSTRESIEASWRAARRSADEGGALVGNPATVAGQYLDVAKGDARVATAMLPTDAGGIFWSRVRSILTEIEEESRAVVPRTVSPVPFPGFRTR